MSAERMNKPEFSDPVIAERSEKNRKEVAAGLGLPEDTRWQKINEINLKKQQSKREIQKPPPPEKTSKFIEKRRQRSEAKRKKMAVTYELPENATWGQINQAILKKINKQS